MRGSSAIDMIGKRFGRLIVLERVENIGDQAAWKCLCDCGNELISRGSSLRRGDTVSCGCHRRELSAERCRQRKKYNSVKDRQQYQKDNRKNKIEQILSEYSTGCLKCGEDRPWVIDFHHIDPNKKNCEIGTIIARYSLDTLKEELPKCVCLCKNCHSDFHHLYGAKPISPVDSLTEYLGRSPHEI